MRSAGLILLGILFIRCQLSIRNSCFSDCMTACLLRYLNEVVCSENCALWILLPDFAYRGRNGFYCTIFTLAVMYIFCFSSFYYCVLMYDVHIK